VTQRQEDPDVALEPVALMARALGRAADDAGCRDLLGRADAILVPRGFWDYRDPGRLVAERVGASRVRSTLAEIGVLQTTLFAEAARAIQEGVADVVLVAGGEAKHRAECARRAGMQASYAEGGDAEPDAVLRPSADILHPLELERGLPMPVRQYAVMENALRHAEGSSVLAHRRDVAELWAAFSRAAAENPYAWSPDPVGADEIASPGGRNRMLAFPYTKLHNSQWNVDQAAGLVLCSLEAARAAGIPESRHVYLRAVVESNHMLPLVEREGLHRAPAAAIAGQRALDLAGLALEEIRHHELYSCFPAAVRIQARELGLDLAEAPTVTGGMTFGGGPLNNFVLQAVARMAEVLRADPGGHGLVTAISGMLTKLGCSVWSTRPGSEHGFEYDDVAGVVERETPRVEVVAEHEGGAVVASYTVVFGAEAPIQGVALCDLPDGRRTIATTTDSESMQSMTSGEWCGRHVRIRGGGVLEL
jgi:acetyl-CoA C-acetyltransferase